MEEIIAVGPVGVNVRKMERAALLVVRLRVSSETLSVVPHHGWLRTLQKVRDHEMAVIA